MPRTSNDFQSTSWFVNNLKYAASTGRHFVVYYENVIMKSKTEHMVVAYYPSILI